VLDEVHGEGGLAHGRAPGDDDEVGFLQPGGEAVEIHVAGAQPGDIAAAVAQLLDALDGLRQEGTDIPRPAGLRPLLADLHDQALGLVDELGGAAPLGIESGVGDALGRLDEPRRLARSRTTCA
jgi:hypothetical protein